MAKKFFFSTVNKCLLFSWSVSHLIMSKCHHVFILLTFSHNKQVSSYSHILIHIYFTAMEEIFMSRNWSPQHFAFQSWLSQTSHLVLFSTRLLWLSFPDEMPLFCAFMSFYVISNSYSTCLIRSPSFIFHLPPILSFQSNISPRKLFSNSSLKQTEQNQNNLQLNGFRDHETWCDPSF